MMKKKWIRFSLFSFALSAVVGGLHSCGNPYDVITDGLNGNNLPNGLLPQFSYSLNDYKNKVSEFDDKANNGNYPQNGQLDPDGGGEGYTNENPFEFDTPARDSMGNNTNFSQYFRNLKNVMDYGLLTGTLRMLVTVSDNTGTREESINTLILPEDFREQDLAGISELVSPLTGYTYTNSVEPEVFCSMAHVSPSDGSLQKIVDLPQLSEMSQEDIDAGDFHCPVTLTEVDYSEGENGVVSLKIETEPLPFYEETRRTIRSLGTYGFLPDTEYALLYELKFETKNSAGEKHYMIYSFYYVVIPIILNSANELGSYKYIGSFEGREYYLMTTRQPATYVKQQAVLMQAAIGASKTYAVDVDSAQEQAWLNGRLPRGHRVWMGLDDMETEGLYKSHSGRRQFRTTDTQFYQNWASGEPNDDGSEDGIHFKSGSIGQWNDTEIENSYMILMEAEFDGTNLNFR